MTSEEHVLICLRRIERVRVRRGCELFKSRSCRPISGVVSPSLVICKSLSFGRSLGNIRTLCTADRQWEDFCFSIGCSLSKSTRRERGDNDGSDVGIAGKTENLFRMGEGEPDEMEFSKKTKIYF